MRTALGRLPIARAPATDRRTDSDRQPAAGARFANDFTAFTKQLHRRIRDAIRPDSDRFVGWLVGQRRLPVPTDRPTRPAEAASRSRGGSQGAAGASSAAAARRARRARPWRPPTDRLRSRAPPAPQRQPARGRTRHARGAAGRRASKQACKQASERAMVHIFRHYG